MTFCIRAIKSQSYWKVDVIYGERKRKIPQQQPKTWKENPVDLFLHQNIYEGPKYNNK